MINDFLKLLEVWRRDKLDLHSRHVYRISKDRCLFALKCGFGLSKVWDRGGTERTGWQGAEIDVPLRSSLWKPPVYTGDAFAPHGCGVLLRYVSTGLDGNDVYAAPFSFTRCSAERCSPASPKVDKHAQLIKVSSNHLWYYSAIFFLLYIAVRWAEFKEQICRHHGRSPDVSVWLKAPEAPSDASAGHRRCRRAN